MVHFDTSATPVETPATLVETSSLQKNIKLKSVKTNHILVETKVTKITSNVKND